jgi:bacillithiol biosynthesis deacetylase BshB1
MSESIDILIFGAHPDDAEIGMGGTIVKHTNAGRRVGICDLTYAEMSSNGNIETRKQEAQEAAQILGLASRTNLGLPDRGLQKCKEQIDLITLEIRKSRPKIVMAPYWHDRHPDHEICSLMVQEAVFNAKLRKYMPETDACLVENLYFYFINDAAEADFIVDISDTHQHKMKALGAYRSQFTEVKAGEDIVPTPLNQGYLGRVAARDQMLGQKSMIAYAEGFKTKLPYLVNLFQF